MCGFAGELAQDRAADVVAVERMAAKLARRGPDGRGSWSSGAIALAHRRLKIIDLSDRGAQPLIDAPLGISLVFNGCIYNYRELRAELERYGYAFFSTSHSEVIAKAYHRWGTACVERFAGMFAFALAERDSGRLVLARDRLGIKPLYLAELDGALRCSSTLPSLLAGGGVDTALDAIALHHYFSWHAVVPPPLTVLKGVRKLPPATVLVVEPDNIRRETTYWDPPHTRSPDHDGIDEQQWADAVLDALRIAVERRMTSDVPVGVLLSGGLDSSLIVALLAYAIMSMAWGVELRTPFLDHELVELAAACPPELKLAHGGKGVLKTAARRVLPDAVIDREKGYFPVPAISHLEGESLERVRDALTSAAARDRGLYRPEHVAALLADPIESRTPIGSSKLWQVGMLELWLQHHGI
jgi:asparagine synthase (glutamine-hydrolysing)